MIENVRVEELPKYIDKGALFIDIREEYEQPKFEFPNQLHIPMSELGERLDEIPKEGDVLIYCHSGGRSANVVATLNLHYGYNNLLNIVGGSLMLAMKFPELKR